MEPPIKPHAALRPPAGTQTGRTGTAQGHAETSLPCGGPFVRTALTPLQDASNPLESTRSSQPASRAFLPDPLARGPLPGDPAYLPHALIRFAPQMDRIGLPQDRREPFLRDLCALVASALDALYPSSVDALFPASVAGADAPAEPAPRAGADTGPDGETIP